MGVMKGSACEQHHKPSGAALTAGAPSLSLLGQEGEKECALLGMKMTVWVKTALFLSS